MMKNRRKILIKYVLPSILSMVSIFLFTVIDGIFVGRGVGTDGLGAVNIVFPYVMIFSALVMLVTVGGMTITSIMIGKKDHEKANRAFMISFVFCLIISAACMILGTVFAVPMCRMLGANDTFLPLTYDYMFWYSIFFIPSGMMMAFNAYVRNDGDPLLVSAATIISTCTNIFGDWLFLFPLGMGLKGAAIATGISESLGLAIVLAHFIRKRGILRFGRFKWDGSIAKKIFIRGLPECISQFSIPVSTIVTNLMLIDTLGETGVNTYSLICYVASFSIAILLGTAEGLQPLFGNCYGARHEDDLRYFFRQGMIIGIAGSVAIVVLLEFVGPGICDLFAVTPATMEMTTAAFSKYSWGFIAAAPNILISSYLYSTTRTRPAVIINVLRSFVINVAVILIVPALFGAEAIWYTFGIYEVIVMLAAILLLVRADRGGIYTESEY